MNKRTAKQTEAPLVMIKIASSSNLDQSNFLTIIQHPRQMQEPLRPVTECRTRFTVPPPSLRLYRSLLCPLYSVVLLLQHSSGAGELVEHTENDPNRIWNNSLADKKEHKVRTQNGTVFAGSIKFRCKISEAPSTNGISLPLKINTTHPPTPAVAAIPPPPIPLQRMLGN